MTCNDLDYGQWRLNNVNFRIALICFKILNCNMVQIEFISSHLQKVRAVAKRPDFL